MITLDNGNETIMDFEFKLITAHRKRDRVRFYALKTIAKHVLKKDQYLLLTELVIMGVWGWS